MNAAAPARWVLAPATTLPALRRSLSRAQGPAQAAAALRDAGYELGGDFYDALRGWIVDQTHGAGPDALPEDQFWPLLSRFFADGGWGRIEHRTLHPGVASLESDDWAEADAASSATGPTCHFSVGLLSELVGKLAGVEVATIEVECRSRGDARCRFLFGSEAALDAVYADLVAGTSADDAIARLA